MYNKFGNHVMCVKAADLSLSSHLELKVPEGEHVYVIGQSLVVFRRFKKFLPL